MHVRSDGKYYPLGSRLWVSLAKAIWSRHSTVCQIRLWPAFLRSGIAHLSVYTLCCRGPKLGHDGTLVAAMQQIGDWLKKLGMSEYAKRFAENDIDMAVLPDLTDQHLKDLGVSLGKPTST